MLLEVASDAEYATRSAAADHLAGLGFDRPAVGAAESGRTSQVYRRILAETRAPRTVEVATGRGTFRLRLDCPGAPLTCLNFLQLADQGFYDGLTFHRLVPGSVIQGGDPRGDGWGGPGYAIRDEIGRLRFGGTPDGGVLGMARRRPDTAGSQFFITLAPRPDLDGELTAFGRVVEGREVLDELLPGDRIDSIHEIHETDGTGDVAKTPRRER
jgi:peptidyl-prolyl cis-trans isomerase B (cyclophilin B)